ncbi:MAG TPA: DUF4175 family protein, partial [Polyangiales bacterium]|nr:DUF4175 family protein [Polyangiales bacterium]
MSPTPPSPASVQDYVRRLRVRLWAVHVLRGLPMAFGSAAAAILVASLFCAPVLTRGAALAVWSVAGLAFLVAFAFVVRGARGYAGAGIARLFAEQDRALSSRVRSAIELDAAGDAGPSSDLLRAHVAAVESVLAKLPREQVLPRSSIAHPSTLAGLAVLGLCILLAQSDAKLSAFASALWSPAPVRADGTRVAHIAQSVTALLTYPSYLAREPDKLTDPTEITAPRGTHVELRLTPLLPAEHGRVLIGDRATSFEPAAGGALVTHFTAQRDAPLRLQIESDGVRYEDSLPRKLHVVVDRVPMVRIDSPGNATLVEPDDVLTLQLTASDDGGLASIDMHARMPSGEDRTRRVWSALDDGGARTELRASSAFAVKELGLAEGESVVIWLEAHDGDLVSGPNTGKSEEITLEVMSPGKKLAAFIPSLQAASDAAVALLGDRLELDVPQDPVAARTRFNRLSGETQSWLAQLDAVVKLAQHSDGGRALDTDQLRGMRKRNQHLLDNEAAMHLEPVQPFGPRNTLDKRHVEELERDVVLLADLLAKAHVDEAGAIADELRDLKKRIEELLAKLDKTHSPEAERQLLAEIEQAERRLAELSQSLSRMATRVPSEFVNREALEAPETDSTLQSLEDAVKKHDLHGAAEHLEKLAQQIDELAKQIGQGGVRLRESRFGPRDQAMAEARQKLAMLSDEQERLAQRSQQVMEGAMSRSQGGNDGSQRAQSLAPQADALRKSLDSLKTGDSQNWGQQSLDRAQSRLDDARDALKSGDLAAANGMAQAAQQDLQNTANELEGEARNMPGNADAQARAERARQAANDATKLSQDIANGAPNLAGKMTPGERQRLQGDVEPQRKTRDATDELREAMNKGPDGNPLSPDGADSLDSAKQAMQRAEDALQRGDPREAAQQQADASSQLKKLAQKLADQQSGKKNGGSGNQPGDEQEANGDSGNSDNAPVHIPGADEFRGPAKMRRKLLDAMR